MLKRIEKLEDLWEPVLGPGIDLAKCLAQMNTGRSRRRSRNDESARRHERCGVYKLGNNLADIRHTFIAKERIMADIMNNKMGQGAFDAEKLSGGCGDKSTAGSSSCCSEQIKEDMDVVASCGKKIGVVDRVEGDSIKLTKKDSPDGHHHRIPNTWLDHVDSHVHLNKNSEEALREWQAV